MTRRTSKNDTGLFLYDNKGKPKMKIYADQSGKVKIEILDEKGQVTNLVQ